MEEYRDGFKFRIQPLASKNYFGCSNDMKIVLKGKGIRNCIKASLLDQEGSVVGRAENENVYEITDEGIERFEKKIQLGDLALAYAFTSIDFT